MKNANKERFIECYKNVASDDILEEAKPFLEADLTKTFFYSKKLNALLDIDIKTFNYAVFSYLKQYTEYPVGKLDEFPFLDNEDVLG